ncbi:hypothetical protein SUGI_0876010 [Cryptomeria japonica]|nr:hypothetical protein SUGI_0876010 [Cryptomeria japonica]
MDQIDTSQLEKLSIGEYTQARRSIGETTNLRTYESPKSNTPIGSDRGQKFLAQDVFLSHSGKQKNFVRQLYRDLTNQGVSCFFDQNSESLPVGEDFPSRIFEAAKTCKVAVLLLSMDFLLSKWPMLELSTFVETRDKCQNPNLKILPLFFQISPDALKTITPDDEKWKELEKSEEKRAEWHQALSAIRRINGLKFIEGNDEVKFRDEIVKEIWRILPTPSPRYHVSCMQGQVRMCQVKYVIWNFPEGIRSKELNLPCTTSLTALSHISKHSHAKISCILLSSRSVDVLEKHFKIDKQSCMHVPGLKEEEAIDILLERTFIEKSMFGAEDKASAVKCAYRCSFKEVGRRVGTFHLLALKAFGGHLSSKCGSYLSNWVSDIEGWVDRCGYGLDDLLALLGKTFDNMCPEYRTIFMLLTLYIPPHMSHHIVNQWLAMILNKEISFIEKAVEDLCKKSFTEESGPQIRIHDLYVEFAQSKANEMRSWLCRKGDPRSTRRLISEDNAGFELAKLEQCMHLRTSQIAPHDLQSMLVLELIDVENMSKLDMGGMGRLRSITLHNCKDLAALEGMEKLQQLAWLQISDVDPMFELPELSSLEGLQHLEINIAGSQVVNHLGDLTGCVFLREINVRCRSLLEFPRLNGLRYLEKVEFSVFDKVKGPLDCTKCVELQSVDLDSCCQMVSSPLLSGCKKLSKIVLWECDAMTSCVDIDVPSDLRTLELSVSSAAASLPKSIESCYGLNNLQVQNMWTLKKLPSFRVLSDLSVLELGKCGIREPPDLTCCVLLEDIYFFTLENLEWFPNFSSLRKLKKLSLYDCWSIEYPPDISGCHELQVFHPVYNDNMRRLPNMGEFPQLEEIKLSWHSEDWHRLAEVTNERNVHWHSENEITNRTYLDWDMSCTAEGYSLQPYEDLQSCLERFKGEGFSNLSDVNAPKALKEWQWMKGKTILVKKYVRGGKLYY